jgi:hypothetical protein
MTPPAFAHFIDARTYALAHHRTQNGTMKEGELIYANGDRYKGLFKVHTHPFSSTTSPALRC